MTKVGKWESSTRNRLGVGKAELNAAIAMVRPARGDRLNGAQKGMSEPDRAPDCVPSGEEIPASEHRRRIGLLG